MGVWGLVIGDWELGIEPNPKTSDSKNKFFNI